MTPLNEPALFLPNARLTGIIQKEVDGELLIYDLTRDKAHCLNETAAAIWKRCDGRTSTKEIVASLTTEVGAAVDERLVWLALVDLRRAHLLTESPRVAEEIVAEIGRPEKSTSGQTGVKPPHFKDSLKRRQRTTQSPHVMLGMSRREAVKRIGLGAAIALPVVISITAPTPAHALSCVQAGGSCGTNAECCVGLLCSGGMCSA